MDFDEILAICIERLAKGATVESCLAHFPDDADLLEPLLRTAELMRLDTKPTLSDEGFRRGRQAVLQAATMNKTFALVHGPSDSAVTLVEVSAKRAETRRRQRSHRSFAWPSLVGTAVAACLLVIVLMAGSQSPNVLPGSSLYRAKLWSEQGQGLLMAATGSEAQWHAQLADRRLAEIQAIQAAGQPAGSEELNRLLGQVNAALESSFALPDGERAEIRAELQRNLDEAANTLMVEAGTLAALQQTQDALRASAGAREIAAVSPTETPATEATALPTKPEPVSESASQQEVAASPTAPPTPEPGAVQALAAAPMATDGPAGEDAAPAAGDATTSDPLVAPAAAADAQPEQSETATQAEPDAVLEVAEAPATEQPADSVAAAPTAPTPEPLQVAQEPPAQAAAEPVEEPVTVPTQPFGPAPAWTPRPEPTTAPALAQRQPVAEGTASDIAAQAGAETTQEAVQQSEPIEAAVPDSAAEPEGDLSVAAAGDAAAQTADAQPELAQAESLDQGAPRDGEAASGGQGEELPALDAPEEQATEPEAPASAVESIPVKLPTATATFTPTATSTVTVAPAIESGQEPQATAQPGARRRGNQGGAGVVLPTATPTREPTATPTVTPLPPVDTPQLDTPTPQAPDAESSTETAPPEAVPPATEPPLLPTPTPAAAEPPALPTPTPAP